ncbi:MAG: hypothetical protein AAFV78_17895 [Bacteroidota bacterium]
MEDILEALDHEIDDRIFDYQSLGGVIEIAVFENVYGDESYSEYDIHQIHLYTHQEADQPFF